MVTTDAEKKVEAKCVNLEPDCRPERAKCVLDTTARRSQLNTQTYSSTRDRGPSKLLEVNSNSEQAGSSAASISRLHVYLSEAATNAANLARCIVQSKLQLLCASNLR